VPPEGCDKFAPDGTRTVFASVKYPAGLAFDSAGNLYAGTYYGSGNIYKITPDGTTTIFANIPGNLVGLAFQTAGPLPLQIYAQPQSQLGYWGMSVSFSVGVTNGVPPYSFQWMKGSNAIFGATNSLLLLTNLQFTDAATYTVVVYDTVTNITSQPAILTVNPAGVSIALYAGVTIAGVIGYTYGIQATTNLSDPNSWIGLANVTLSTATQIWYDSQPATLPQRYYRVVAGPITIP
jgi:hypothetical protein